MYEAMAFLACKPGIPALQFIGEVMPPVPDCRRIYLTRAESCERAGQRIGCYALPETARSRTAPRVNAGSLRSSRRSSPIWWRRARRASLTARD